MNRWTIRVALAFWLAVGIAALVADTDVPAGPELAARLYGEERSMRSAAPTGTLAFARTLEALGFESVVNRRAGAPDAEVLFLLSPAVELADREIEALLAWLTGGGRVVYASRGDLALDDLADAIRERGQRLESAGAAEVWRVGDGRAALLLDGGEVLSNRALREHGLGGELAWLRPLLAGARRVAFDEARLGLAPAESIVDVAVRSRYAPALALAMLALVVWFVATSSREQPAVPTPRPEGRDFSDHLDALGAALAERHRDRLAGELMSEGTARRLGNRVSRPSVRLRLEALSSLAPTSEGLVARARGLRDLENDEGQRPRSRGERP